jgi:hypothetical protein
MKHAIGLLMTSLRTAPVIIAILAPFLLGAGAYPIIELSTPEQTVRTYYRGYKQGDRTIIAQTFLNKKPEEISKTGLGFDVEYTIERIHNIMYSRSSGTEGDIEIITHANWSGAQGTDEMRTSFLLRKSKEGWKIVEYDSVPWGKCVEGVP